MLNKKLFSVGSIALITIAACSSDETSTAGATIEPNAIAENDSIIIGSDNHIDIERTQDRKTDSFVVALGTDEFIILSQRKTGSFKNHIGIGIDGADGNGFVTVGNSDGLGHCRHRNRCREADTAHQCYCYRLFQT